MPLKIFVLENEGYLAIKTTQKSFFGGYFTGSNPASGVVCPNLEKIANAYGIPYVGISEEGQALTNTIADVLDHPGSMICEIHMHPEQTCFRNQPLLWARMANDFCSIGEDGTIYAG